MVEFIIALAKAVPAFATILEQAVDGYRAWRVSTNNAAESDKNRRNDAAIDAAIAGGMQHNQSPSGKSG